MTYINIIKKKTTLIPYINNRFDFNNNKNILPKKYKIYSTSNNKTNLSIINKIKKIFIKKFGKLKKLLCLDYHGITDLYQLNEKIPSKLNKCIISYIGSNLNTFGSTINSIVPRIQSGEVKLGIIVHVKNIQPIIGTKGYIINLISKILPKLKIYFIDDSLVNIKCVNHIKNNNIYTYYINKRYYPKYKLNKCLYKIDKIDKIDKKFI